MTTCPSCGLKNAVEAEACVSCGKPLVAEVVSATKPSSGREANPGSGTKAAPQTSPSATQIFRQDAARAERFRRNLTVMFTDIKGSTSYFDRRGNTMGFAMIQRHNKLLFPVVEVHHGTIVKTIGDAIMARFDEPGRGVAAAIDMQKALAEHNAPLPSEERIEIRIGLNHGVGILEEKDVFGDVVNVASRVQHHCLPNQILIASSVYDAVRDNADFFCQPLSRVKLAGKAEEEQLFLVVWNPDQLKMMRRKELKGICCSRCKHLNEPGSRFCGECGNPLQAAADSGAVPTLVLRSRNASGREREWKLTGRTIVIGRHSGDVSLPDDQLLSFSHVRLEWRSGQWFLRDLGSTNGTYVRIRGQVPLELDSWFLVGSYRFQVAPSDQPGAPPALWVLGADNAVLGEIPVDRDAITIGREGADLGFPDDPAISGLHARLLRKSGQFFLEDLRSSNGTFLRVIEEMAVELGDSFIAGAELFVMQTEKARS